jgi:putative FmdB family regulatory protein
MPIYEYQCESCSAVVEKIQPFSAKPPACCEICGGGPMRKLVSQSSFILKGGGWYKDGYASHSSGARDSSGDNADNKSEAKTTNDSNKSESKSANGSDHSETKTVSASDSDKSKADVSSNSSKTMHTSV